MVLFGYMQWHFSDFHFMIKTLVVPKDIAII